MDWFQAKSACEREGSHLAYDDNHNTHNYITHNFGRNAGYWMGASDHQHEGRWVWTNGQPVHNAPWNRGEPNNQGNEDCAINNAGSAGRWNDGKCHDKLWFLCQKGEDTILLQDFTLITCLHTTSTNAVYAVETIFWSKMLNSLPPHFHFPYFFPGCVPVFSVCTHQNNRKGLFSPYFFPLFQNFLKFPYFFTQWY